MASFVLSLRQVAAKKNVTGPLSTCRFNTRIDYVYLSPQLAEEASVRGCVTVEDDASDHNMVMAELELPVSSMPEVGRLNLQSQE